MNAVDGVRVWVWVQKCHDMEWSTMGIDVWKRILTIFHRATHCCTESKNVRHYFIEVCLRVCVSSVRLWYMLFSFSHFTFVILNSTSTWEMHSDWLLLMLMMLVLTWESCKEIAIVCCKQFHSPFQKPY